MDIQYASGLQHRHGLRLTLLWKLIIHTDMDADMDKEMDMHTDVLYVHDF